MYKNKKLVAGILLGMTAIAGNALATPNSTSENNRSEERRVGKEC